MYSTCQYNVQLIDSNNLQTNVYQLDDHNCGYKLGYNLVIPFTIHKISEKHLNYMERDVAPR